MVEIERSASEVALRRCPACLAETVVCPNCAGASRCPACPADHCS